MQDQDNTDKGSRKLAPESIRAEFNSSKEDFRGFADRSGLTRALASLSDMLGDLQDAGLDVSLEMLGGASEQAFDLFKENSITVPVSGILRIGPIHRLLGISTSLEGKPALVIGLSEFDIRYSGPEGVVREGVIDGKLRAVHFDLNADPDALLKLEKTIIRYAARSEAIADIDDRRAFENTKSLYKPTLRIPPPTP